LDIKIPLGNFELQGLKVRKKMREWGSEVGETRGVRYIGNVIKIII
jgi:hypothetical protein